MKRTLAVAKFWYEGNAFSPVATTFNSFLEREWSEGAAALEAASGFSTELAAVADLASKSSDWDVQVLRCASANPGGPIDEPAFDAILEDIVTRLSRRQWDAVYLSLSGATVTAERALPELHLVHRIRDVVGEIPIAASFGCNANLAPEYCDVLDFASGAAHGEDVREAAARALDHLLDIATTGQRPHGAIVNTGLPISGSSLLAGEALLAEIAAQARKACVGSCPEVTAFIGFPYSDTPHAGASIMAYGGDSELEARVACGGVAQFIAMRRLASMVSLPGPNQALQEALRSEPGLVTVTDPSDDPMSGGACDTPGLFRALLELGSGGGAVFALFADPEAVRRCAEAGSGARIGLELGARLSRDFGAMIPVTARVLRLTDGGITDFGPIGAVRQTHVGPTALVEVAGTQVILTSRRPAAIDIGLFTLHGIDLAKMRILCIKAGGRRLGSIRALSRRVIECDAPGPAGIALGNLPFRNLRITR